MKWPSCVVRSKASSGSPPTGHDARLGGAEAPQALLELGDVGVQLRGVGRGRDDARDGDVAAGVDGPPGRGPGHDLDLEGLAGQPARPQGGEAPDLGGVVRPGLRGREGVDDAGDRRHPHRRVRVPGLLDRRRLGRRERAEPRAGQAVLRPVGRLRRDRRERDPPPPPGVVGVAPRRTTGPAAAPRRPGAGRGRASPAASARRRGSGRARTRGGRRRRRRRAGAGAPARASASSRPPARGGGRRRRARRRPPPRGGSRRR